MSRILLGTILGSIALLFGKLALPGLLERHMVALSSAQLEGRVMELPDEQHVMSYLGDHINASGIYVSTEYSNTRLANELAASASSSNTVEQSFQTLLQSEMGPAALVVYVSEHVNIVRRLIGLTVAAFLAAACISIALWQASPALITFGSRFSLCILLTTFVWLWQPLSIASMLPLRESLVASAPELAGGFLMAVALAAVVRRPCSTNVTTRYDVKQ